MERKTIIVDFDGVIGNSIKAICSLYNKDFKWYKGYKRIDWTEINSWNFEELTLTSRSHIDDYFDQYRFFEHLDFMENAKECLMELHNDFNIVVCSMGNDKNLKYKKEWMYRNLPFINEFIGVNFKDYSDKSHIEMSGCIFIDDSSNNLITSNADIKILYGEVYSWNEDWTGERCYNWTEVVNILKQEITN